eukprot:3155532-Pyramimonas_sp.AAC.1
MGTGSHRQLKSGSVGPASNAASTSSAPKPWRRVSPKGQLQTRWNGVSGAPQCWHFGETRHPRLWRRAPVQ